MICAPRSGQTSCFGKLLAQHGDHLWQMASTLYQASQADPELPRISQPLAYRPEHADIVSNGCRWCRIAHVRF